MSTTVVESPPSGSDVKSRWFARALHTIILPSGEEVVVRIPDITNLARNESIPESLRAAVIKQDAQALLTGTASASEESQPKPSDADVVRAAAELGEAFDYIVLDMIVEPVLTISEVRLIPSEDRDFLALIAQRQRDTDALGRRLGVEPLSRWERFRHHHGCAEDCAECEALRREFSTVHMGAM